MKIDFEKREKVILLCFLHKLEYVATEEKLKKERKLVRKTLEKLTGENLTVNLKPYEVTILAGIVKTTINEAEKPIKEGEIAELLPEDLLSCKNLYTKLVK